VKRVLATFAVLLSIVGTVALANNGGLLVGGHVVGSSPPPSGPPTPPTQAAVAGFTTCVLCIDFTRASGGVWVNGVTLAGVNASDTSTWLDCAGASNPVLFQGTIGGVQGPCPTIVTDTNGKQVLQIDLPAGTGTNGGTGANNGLQHGVLSTTNLGRMGALANSNLYMESNYRIPVYPTTYTGNPISYAAGPWLGGPDGAPSAQGQWNFLEGDAQEIFGNPNVGGGYDACFHTWYTGGTFYNFGTPGCVWEGSFPPGFPGGGFISNYITTGIRTTSDGSTARYQCGWLNTTFANCVHANVDNSTMFAWQVSDASSRHALNIDAVGFNQLPTNGSAPAEIKEWVDHLYIWSCAGWQTTACNTSSADPGGY
jgi:hypothetical protein